MVRNWKNLLQTLNRLKRNSWELGDRSRVLNSTFVNLKFKFVIQMR
jgi:hypothetical protein